MLQFLIFILSLLSFGATKAAPAATPAPVLAASPVATLCAVTVTPPAIVAVSMTQAGRAPEPPAPPAQPSGDAKITTNVTIIEDVSNGQRIRVELRGDTTTATINGKDVPADRIQREGGVIRILDEKGETVYSTRVFDRSIYNVRDIDANVRVFGGAMGEGRNVFDPVTLGPRPMIGVTLDNADDALAEQLGLDPKAVVVIREVTPGLPAEKAGLERFDIVTHINGDTPAGADDLRRVVGESKPGDTITLRVLRQGQTRDINVVVENVERPNVLRFPAEGNNARDAIRWQAQAELSEEAARRVEAARRLLVERQEQINALRERLTETLRERLDGVELEEIEATIKRLTDSIQNMQLDINLPSIRLVPGADQEREVIVMRPSTPAPPAPALRSVRADSDERLRSLEERMARIEALLEKLVESDR